MTTFLLYLFLCGLNGLAVAYGSSWLCNIEMPDNLRLSFIALTALFSFVLFGIMHIFDQIMLPGVTGELSAAKEKIEQLEKQLAANNAQMELMREDCRVLRNDLERSNQRPISAKKIGEAVVDEIVGGKIDAILSRASGIMSDYERMNSLIQKNTELRDTIAKWKAHSARQDEVINARDIEISTLQDEDKKHVNAIIRLRSIIAAMDRLSTVNGLQAGFLRKNAQKYVDQNRKDDTADQDKEPAKREKTFIPSKPYRKMSGTEYREAKRLNKHGY